MVELTILAGLLISLAWALWWLRMESWWRTTKPSPSWLWRALYVLLWPDLRRRHPRR